MKYIKIEPSELYDLAVIKKAKNGMLTYSWYRLVEVCAYEYGFGTEDAEDWVEYNILGHKGSGESQRFKVSNSLRHKWSLPFAEVLKRKSKSR